MTSASGFSRQVVASSTGRASGTRRWRDIARESGVPLGNVYYYFRTKDESADAVAHRLGDEFRERAAALESVHPEPRARLLYSLDAVVSNRDALAEHGCP